jgi:tetratricopeptide (TPR) repeat protein
MYFETDPHLTQELILAFGEKLRTYYYTHLPEFVDEIQLVDKREFCEMHADFLSRLGMTFSHGDYSKIETIKDKDQAAEKLYRRALDYHPDHRAYLGLGILMQKQGAHEESVKSLSKGIEYFPESEQLGLCLGISLMNLGEYMKALSAFLKFQDSKEAVFRTAQCYKALGDFEMESAFLERLASLQNDTV